MADELLPLYTLTSQPGVRRDGTTLDSPFYSDGEWVRWQRGKPRKMGGYRVSAQNANGPVRSVVIDSRNGIVSAHYFSPWGVQRQQLGVGGSGAALEDRTPSGFAYDPTLTWTHGFMYSAVGSTFAAIIAASSPDLNDITNDIGGGVYYGNATDSSLLTAIADANGPISVSGGCCVLQPFLFVYGSNGLIYNSNPNDLSTATGWTLGGGNRANKANVSGTKIVYGAPTRGGSASPAGLFWALDSLIRVTFTGGTALWSYDPLSATTVLGKKAIVEHDGQFFWPGIDRFYVYAGVVQELPNDMNQNWFFDNLNYTYRNKVWGTKIERYGEIWWFYPRGSDVECNDAIIFNYRENTWYDAHLSRTAGDKAQTYRFPIWVGSEDGLNTTRLTTATQASTSSTSAAGLAAPTQSAATTSSTGGSLAPGTLFAYKITALNAAGESLGSNERLVTTPNGIAPPTPNAPTVSSSGGTLTPNTTYFYKLTTINGTGETQGSSEVSVTTPAALSTPSLTSAVNNTSAGNLAASTQFFYKITATNAAGETLPSNEVNATTAAGIGAPTGVSATPLTTGGTFTTQTLFYKITAINGIGETIGSSEVSASVTGGVANVTASSAVFNINGFNGNFAPNTTYFFKVTAVNGTGETIAANEVSVTTPALVGPPTLNTPTNGGAGSLAAGTYFYKITSLSSATVGAAESTASNEVSLTVGASGAVSLSWNTVSGAAGGYKVYRGTSSGGENTTFAIAAGLTAFTDTGGAGTAATPPTTNTTAEGDITVSWTAQAGATDYHVYQGTAAGSETGYYIVGAGGAATSYVDEGFGFNFHTASPPSSNTTGGAASVSLSWTAVTGATGYRVYRGSSSGAENLRFSAGLASFTDTGASGASATPPGVDSTTNNQNVISWPAVTGATGYNVYRGTATGAENVHYAAGNVTSFNDTGATSTAGAPPGSNTTASPSVSLSWGAVTGATGYKVYRGTTAGNENVFYAPGNVTSFTDTNATSTAGSPPGSNTTGAVTCSNGLSWGAVSGATGYKVYRGTAAGAESVFYSPGNVTTFTDTGAASTNGTPPAHNTTQNILNIASVPVAVHTGMLVSGDPGIAPGATVTAVGANTVTLSDALTSAVAGGVLITFSEVTTGNTFALGDTITGGTSGATGRVVRVTNKDVNVTDVTGAFVAAESITNGRGVSGVINSAPVTQELDAVYQHETGYDKVVNQQVSALRSSFTTCNFGFACGGPFADVPQTVDTQTRVTRIEPDWNQVGKMTVTVNGRPYAQTTPKVLQSYDIIPGLTQKQDIRAQARILTLTVTSNDQGGFYEVGQVLVGLEPGDVRTDAA